MGGLRVQTWLPAEIDTTIQDTDGSKFIYGAQRRVSPTIHTYYSHENRVEGFRTDGRITDSGEVRTSFYWWDLSDIPANAQIIDATYYTQCADTVYGYKSMNVISCVDAMLDTSSANYGLLRSGVPEPGNASVYDQSWDLAVVAPPKTVAWATPSEPKLWVEDYGWRVTAVLPGEAVDANKWWHCDVKQIVQKIVSDQLLDRLVWFTYHEDLSWLSSSKDWDQNIGPTAANINSQPGLVVTWATRADYPPVRFLSFGDNHANPTGVKRMRNTLGDAVGDFAIHNGDGNQWAFMDTLTVSGDSSLVGQMLEQFGADYPLILGWGNHEEAADDTSGGNDKMHQFVVGRNRIATASMAEWGADWVKTGPKGYSETKQDKYKSISFDVGAAHIVVINPINPITGLASLNVHLIRWLKNDLELTKQPMKLVFCHYPLWDFPDIDSSAVGTYGCLANAKEAQDFFDGLGVHAYISGHTHLGGIAKVGSMYLLQGPSTCGVGLQGFFTFDVDPTGQTVVDLYRGVQALVPWMKLHTITIPVVRTPAAVANGIIATSGKFGSGDLSEIIGAGFGAAQGAGSVAITNSAVWGDETELDLQTATSWSDTWIEITANSENVSAGPAWMWVTTDGGVRYGGTGVSGE